MSFNFDLLKSKIISGIKESVKGISNNEKDETIYAYSLLISSNDLYIGVCANTKEYLEENIENEEDRAYYKYCEQEWKIYNETNEYFEETEEIIKKYLKENSSLISDKNSIYTDFFEDFREKVLSTGVDALIETKEINEFKKIQRVGGFINFMVPEYLDQEESIDIFTRLNNGETVEEYKNNIEEFL